MTARPPVIRTPDQRLRVFVSSTLHELAEERAAVREAIERIRLTPVLFEAGARPHPPRDLYRAYLEQSYVFVAIYWNRYGWVAPDMAISGLEDEYRLSAGMPRLVYVKRSDGREPRLDELLARMTSEDSLSFRPFATAAELAGLVADDLAHLLTEGFARDRQARVAGTEGGRDERTAPPPLAQLPEVAGALHGRDGLLDQARTMLERGETRLLTLTGPGGVGKTTFAVHLAHLLARRYADGAAYLSLASVREPEGVLPALIGTLELPPPPPGTEAERHLLGHLRARRALLVIDNFEQVIDAAPLLAAILGACRGLVLLVTSRTPLRLSGERELRVPTLAGPGGPEPSPAARLFEERARAVRPGFRLDEANRQVVEALCKRLDGLPLAIELAAARARVLTPAAMLPRLDQALSLLTSGARDLPMRQRTLRGAFEWSYELLSPAERAGFRRLGAISGSFSLELAAAVVGDAVDTDIVDLLESLVDKSLVVQGELAGEPRISLLETAREFAAEKLALEDDERAARVRLVDWALELMGTIARGMLHSVFDGDAFLREQAHVTAALAFCSGPRGDVDRGWRLFPPVALALLALARVREAQSWHARLSAAGPCRAEDERARAETVMGVIAQATGDLASCRRTLEPLGPVLEANGDAAYRVWSSLFLAQAHAAEGDPERAMGLLQAAAEGAARLGAPTLIAASRMNQAMLLLMTGDRETASKLVEETSALCARTGERTMVSLMVALAGLLALLDGDLDRARGKLANAVALGRETHNPWGPGMAYPLLAGLALATGDDDEAEAIVEAGLAALRPAGLGTGTLEALAGVRGALALRRGDLALAAALLQLVPDGFEDTEAADAGLFDPRGVLRGEIREARRILGGRGRAAADRDGVLDEVLDRLLRGSAP